MSTEWDEGHDPDKDVMDDYEKMAEAWGNTIDPLAKYEKRFRSLDVDPFEMWREMVLKEQGLAEGTKTNIWIRVNQWRGYMAEQGRHPACPTERHAKEFAQMYLDQGNTGDEVARKLGTLERIFEWFGQKRGFPHDNKFNPFGTAIEETNLETPDPKPPRPVEIEDLRETVKGIKHVVDRAYIVVGLKLGLRGSEICNIKLSEVHISNEVLLDYYDEMGTHPALEGRSDAVYIPHDRKLNKSKRPRVIPLDDEMKRTLLQYLLARPDHDEPWLFLSKTGGNKMQHSNVNDVWHKHFRNEDTEPHYGPIKQYRGWSSHTGRHFLTTWLDDRGVRRKHIQYLRGDKLGGGDELGSRIEAIDHYIHTYYPDVRQAYLDNAPRLHI